MCALGGVRGGGDSREPGSMRSRLASVTGSPMAASVRSSEGKREGRAIEKTRSGMARRSDSVGHGGGGGGSDSVGHGGYSVGGVTGETRYVTDHVRARHTLSHVANAPSLAMPCHPLHSLLPPTVSAGASMTASPRGSLTRFPDLAFQCDIGTPLSHNCGCGGESKGLRWLIACRSLSHSGRCLYDVLQPDRMTAFPVHSQSLGVFGRTR